MKLFQQSYKWLNSPTSKRIRLTFPSGLSESALFLALSANRLTEFDSLFCLDVNRDSSPTLFHSLGAEMESFIYQPSSWNEVIQSVQEVNEFAQIKGQEGKLFSGTTFVLNDWQSLQYLYSSSRRFNGPNPQELLLQLKFMSDKMNFVLLNNLGYSSDASFQSSQGGFGDDYGSEDSLFNWSQASLRMQDKYSLLIEKSLFPAWKVGEKINLMTSSQDVPSNASFQASAFVNSSQNQGFITKEMPSSAPSPSSFSQLSEGLNMQAVVQSNQSFAADRQNAAHNQASETPSQILKAVKSDLRSSETAARRNFERESQFNAQQARQEPEEEQFPVKSQYYDLLVERLSQANTRQELLVARKEIQSKSSVLGQAEKSALSDIYKINLQRIKLLEDSFQSISSF